MPNPHEELRDTSDQQKAHQELIRKFLADPKIGIENIPDEDLNRYQLAFTHSSVTNGKESYERLEWLGDRVLNLIAAGHLYDTCKELTTEGKLSEMLKCISNDNLQKIIAENDLFPSKIIRKSGNVPDEQLYPDVCESLVGAIFLHQGFDATKEIVVNLFGEEFNSFDPKQNFKGQLQEKFQKMHLPIPEYHLDKTEGEQHKPTYTCSVTAGDKKRVNGKGSRIIYAEQEAAKNALDTWDLPE